MVSDHRAGLSNDDSQLASEKRADLEALVLPARPRWRDTARCRAAGFLHLEIGVNEEELIRRCGPDQLRALNGRAHPGHPQLE